MKPGDLIKMKRRLKLFEEQHPKMPAFLKHVGKTALKPGSVLELKVTTPEGTENVTNIRLTPDDVETLKMLDLFD